MKLAAAIDKYEAAKTLSGRAEKTLNQYEYVLGGLGEYLGRNPELEEITPDDVRGYLQHLSQEQGLANTTVAIHHRNLTAFFRWYIEEGELEVTPMRNVEEPSTPDKFPRIISQEQVDKLLDHERNRLDEWSGMRNFTMLVSLLDMGLRRQEFIDAKIDDLDLQSRNLKVHGKGAKDRRVRFGRNTRRMLKKWLRVRGDIAAPVEADTIFIGQNGKKLKPRNVGRLISRIADRAGVGRDNVSPHVLRHTSATMAVQNGMDNFTLKQQYGWESVETAMKYVHMVGKRFDDAFDKTSPMDNYKSNGNGNGNGQKRNGRGEWENE